GRPRRLHGGGEPVGGDRHVPGNTAEARAERAEVDRAVVAVAGRGTRERGEITLTAGIDEGPGGERVAAAMVVIGDTGHAAVVARRAGDEGVQQDLDARLLAQPV